jgi:predicted aspartyl protease
MDEGLLVMLSRILMKERAYGEVAVLLRDAFFANPDLEMSLGASLARAERMQDRPGNVVIDYPPGSKSIHATVALNGVVGEFIVDTGASTTMVPDDLARRASLDTGVNVPRVLIRTAGNERILPFSPVDSVSVGSLSVTGLSVVVGDLSGLGNLGLLGMDFLGQFGFENDSVNGRFVIFAR